MLTGCCQAALLGLLLLLPVPAMEQQPFMSPGSDRDLESQRAAARARTRAAAEDEGTQQTIVLWTSLQHHIIY
jgi:hypothetical protein